jgi:GxxExxY protein
VRKGSFLYNSLTDLNDACIIFHLIHKILLNPGSKQFSMAELKYRETTEKIIGAAMKVHAALGNGFQEVIYQRALAIEFTHIELPFEREFNMKVFYKNIEVGERRVDFLVEGKIMVELKALVNLESVHLAQAKNYLEAYNVEVGLLINFGAQSLQFKRLENQKFKSLNISSQS